MKPKSYRLLVVAHPDDETIFFGGALLRLRDLPWHVICVTDGNADGRGAERKKEFAAATKLLGAKKSEHWEYRDLFPDRLPVDEIVARLRALPTPKEVFTHGPLGEYGHPHHQDVCLAAHRAFPKTRIFSPAWNAQAELVLPLTRPQFAKKTKAFIEIYRKETSRFLNILPNMSVETFRRFSTAEVEALVGFIRRERPLAKKELAQHAWAAEVLPGLRDKLETRLF